MAGPAGGRVGLGVAFQPVRGAQLVRPADGDGVARVPARAGEPVHAVVAGMVLDVDGRGGVTLRDADGAGYRYAGLAAGSLTVGAGVTVAAGDVLGAVGAAGALELRLTGADGYPRDAVEALLGLADPNELGYAPPGSGPDVDPDAMDRAIVAAGVPGPADVPW